MNIGFRDTDPTTRANRKIKSTPRFHCHAIVREVSRILKGKNSRTCCQSGTILSIFEATGMLLLSWIDTYQYKYINEDSNTKKRIERLRIHCTFSTDIKKF